MSGLYNKLRRIFTIVLVNVIVIAQFYECFVYAAEKTDYLALQANSYNLDCKTNINGMVVKGGINDFSGGLFYLLEGDENVADQVEAEQPDYLLTTPVYCYNDFRLNTNNFTSSSILASKGSIIINSENITSEGVSVIYSNSGDIIINCDDINFSGIIYAPNGQVKIKSKEVSVKGCIIGDSIRVEAKKLKVSPTEESESLVSFLKYYRNDGYMCFDAYFENENLCFYCDSNLNMNRGIIYARFEDEQEFVEIGEIPSNQGMIENVRFNNKLDIIVEGRTIFDEKIASDVISFEKDETGNISYVKQDSDNDGVEDGIEIFYLKSNPYQADTDNDGMEDGVEAYHLYTNPIKPDSQDEDFDGEKDDEDKNPSTYDIKSKVNEVPKMKLGIFDKIITYIDSDGNCTQMVYDFINEKVKLEENGELIKAYYYDYDMNLSNKITSYNDEIMVNHYEYDEGNITAIYNNDYKYSFEFDDNKHLTKVKLNDIALVEYEYLEDGKKIRYANGCCSNNLILDNNTVIGENYTYSYDDIDNIETYQYNDSGIVVHYCYDEEEDLVGVDTNVDFSIAYDKAEEQNGSISNITYSMGNEVYTQIDSIKYDEQEGKRTTTKFITGDEVTKYYDGKNSLVEKYIIKSNEYYNKIQYDEDSRIEKIIYDEGTTLEYKYNSKGFIREITKNGIITNEYEYDLLDRLACEKNIIHNEITYYSYDLSNNITESITYEYFAGSTGRLISHKNYVYSDEYGDQLIRFNGNDIIYDLSGKPLSYYNGYTYTWDGNRLIRAVNDEKEIELFYDNNGTVIRKIVNGVVTDYYVEGIDYIAEVTAGKDIVYMYDSEADLIGFTYDNNTYYYLKNSNKDIIKIVDGNNEYVCDYEYDAWGNIIQINGDEEIAELNKYRYRSYYYDTDMGLYYLHSRYYDSQSGRFISTDNVDMMVYNDENLNLYSYCNNNPVFYFDPEGTARKVMIMSLEGWKSESNNIGQDFKEYYNSLGEACSVDYLYSDNFNEYEAAWNSLSGYNVVLINTHATPRRLSNSSDNFGNGDSLFIYEIDNLEFKYIPVLILLGCNAGHYDYVWSNIAHAFSKRISGCVIASDGTVQANSRADVEFNSVLKQTFIDACIDNKKRKNYGWVAYRYKRNNGTSTYTVIGIYKITIKSIMTNLKSHNYYK